MFFDDERDFGSDGWSYERGCMERDAAIERSQARDEMEFEAAIERAEFASGRGFSDLPWPAAPVSATPAVSPDDDDIWF